MAERPAVNASPLIFLSRADMLDMLKIEGERIVVPKTVADELKRRGPGDPTVQAIEKTSWLEVLETPPIPAVIQAWDLGEGESSVLTSAHGPCVPWNQAKIPLYSPSNSAPSLRAVPSDRPKIH